jgi:cobalt-zinc-cadmium efflux system outer membrane protein
MVGNISPGCLGPPTLAQLPTTPPQFPNQPTPRVQPTAFIEAVQIGELPEPLQLPTPIDEKISGLTLKALEQIALDNNPSVGQAVAKLRALQGKWVQAGLPPNPRVGYLSEDVGIEGTSGKQGAFVGQKFITGGKLDLDQAVVSREIMQSEQQLTATRQRVLTDVRIGYYDVLIAQRKLKLAGELVDISNQAVRASQQLLKAKEIPRVGLLQTEIEAQTAHILLRRAKNGNVAAWRRLNSVIGGPDLALQPLEGDLDQITNDLEWNEQLERLVTKSPEVATAVAELERARSALGRAHAQVIPDLNVQVALQYDNLTEDTITGVQVGLPIPLWNRNQGGIQRAWNDIVTARRNIHRVELDLQQRLAIAFQQYADARYQVGRFSDNILPTAKETFDLVSEGYQKGEVGYLDMLTAQRTYFRANLSYIEALRELWRVTVRIEGMLLEDSLANASRALEK